MSLGATILPEDTMEACRKMIHDVQVRHLP